MSSIVEESIQKGIDAGEEESMRVPSMVELDKDASRAFYNLSNFDQEHDFEKLREILSNLLIL